MAEFAPVTDVIDVLELDRGEVMVGYQLGLANSPEPLGSWASRAVWHGWRNGRVDAGHAENDAAQFRLAHDWQVATCFTGALLCH